MTREEREQALEWFKNRPVTMSGAKKMYDLAIEALSAVDKDIHVPNTDCISRQDAIDAFDKEIWSNIDIPICKGIRSAVKKTIEQLPPVQPEKRTNKRTETHACDLISRAAAIDAVHTEFDDCLVWDESGEHTANEVEQILDRVPSAQPERKTGHWVGARQYCRHLEEVTGEKYSLNGIDNIIYCDQCWQASDRKSNYCPDCGSYNGGRA